MPGIDQQVQQTVDQFRGNPQGLQKRYQQNQQLLDLLALQRLKSEKDAAARAMQMQMQSNPQTIKAQREQELLQRTKQEMAQQVGGVMQQQAQQQQQRAQAAGLGGLARPPQAGAPMPKMASGGIVALAEGGDVDAKKFGPEQKYSEDDIRYAMRDVAKDTDPATVESFFLRVAQFDPDLKAVVLDELGKIYPAQDDAGLQDADIDRASRASTAQDDDGLQTDDLDRAFRAPPERYRGRLGLEEDRSSSARQRNYMGMDVAADLAGILGGETGAVDMAAPELAPDERSPSMPPNVAQDVTPKTTTPAMSPAPKGAPLPPADTTYADLAARYGSKPQANDAPVMPQDNDAPVMPQAVGTQGIGTVVADSPAPSSPGQGQVTDEDIDAYLKSLNPRSRGRTTRAQAAAILAKRQDASAQRAALTAALKAAPNRKARQNLLQGRTPVATASAATAPAATAPAATTSAPTTPTMLGGQGPLRSLGKPAAAAPAVNDTRVMPQAAGTQGLATLGFGDLPSREEAIAAGRRDAAEFFDTKGEMEKYNAMIAEQEKRNAAMFDPRTERQEGLQALLAGMAGSVSNPLAAGAAGAINARAAQRSARFAREKDLMDKRTAGLDRLRELRAAEYGAGTEEGKQNVEMRKANLDAALEQAKLDDANLTRMAIENAGNKTRLLETQATLAQNKAKFIAENIKDDTVLQTLALSAAADPEAAQEYALAMEAKRRSLATQYDEATAESRAIIAQELERLGVVSGQPSRASGSQLDLTSLGVNPTDLAAALQRNQ